MEEEAKTADLRKQFKDDKKKFDEAMDCILALEKSVSGPSHNSDVEDFLNDDVDVDLVLDHEQSIVPVSELGEAYLEPAQALGEGY